MKKKIITISTVAVLLVVSAIILVFCLKGNKGKTVDINSTLDSVRPSLVKITVGEYHGSGVIMHSDTEKVCIVTTAHLMKGAGEGMITFSDGKSGFGTVKSISKEKDLCFLEIDGSDLDAGYLKGILPAKYDLKNYEGLKKEDTVYLMGSGVLLSGNVFVGTVANTCFYVPEFDMHMLYLYSDAMEGMSGCGCFDESGYLLGILIGATESSEAVCVPLADILSFMGID